MYGMLGADRSMDHTSWEGQTQTWMEEDFAGEGEGTVVDGHGGSVERDVVEVLVVGESGVRYEELGHAYKHGRKEPGISAVVP